MNVWWPWKMVMGFFFFVLNFTYFVSFSIGGVSVGHLWSWTLVGLYWFWDLWASYLFGGGGGCADLEWNLINLGGGCCADLEWKLIYVGSAEDEKYDQVLESVLVGPLNVGNYRFVFQVPRSFPIGTQINLFPCFCWNRIL
jgi:hypothetical protein